MTSKKEFLVAALNGDLETVKRFLTSNQGKYDVNTEVKYNPNFGIDTKDRFSFKGLKGLIYKNTYYRQFNFYHDQNSIAYDSQDYHYVHVPGNILNFRRNYRHGMTALSLAAEMGHSYVVDTLLDVKDIRVNSTDSNGRSPLTLAAMYGHTEIVRSLKKHKRIEINSQDYNGVTALMAAAKFGHLDAVRVLLESKQIEINLCNRYGCSALMLAIIHGHEAIVNELLNDPRIDLKKRLYIPHSLYSLVELAKLYKHPEIGEKIQAKIDQLFPEKSFQDRLAALNKSIEVPEDLICPISGTLMNDPLTGSNGVTYDREALRAYFRLAGNPDSLFCPGSDNDILKSELENETSKVVKDCLETFVKEQEALHQETETPSNDYSFRVPLGAAANKNRFHHSEMDTLELASEDSSLDGPVFV